MSASKTNTSTFIEILRTLESNLLEWVGKNGDERILPNK